MAALRAQSVIDVTLQHIIAMQYPVVLLLGVLCCLAGWKFRSGGFVAVGVGWLLNLAYLISANPAFESYFPVGDRAPFNPTLTNVLVFGSSTAFWMAARSSRFSPENRVLPRPGFLFDLVSYGAIVGLCLAPQVVSPTKWGYLAVAVPSAAFHCLALYGLSLFYAGCAKRTTAKPAPVVLRAGLVLYFVVQWLVLFKAPGVDWLSPDTIKHLGFTIGLLAKGLVLGGLGAFFVDAAALSQSQQARAQATQRVAERVSHELATPLSQLGLVSVELGTNMPARSGYRDAHRRLGQIVERLEGLIDAARQLHVLGTLDQFAAGECDAECRTVKVNALVQLAVIAIKETRDEEALFSLRLAGNLCISCLASEVVQILINLMRNSVDAMPDGVGEIIVTTRSVRTTESAEHGEVPEVEVIVEDDGEGIPKALEKRVLEDGFSTRDRIARGHGLTVVRELATRNRGRFWFEARQSASDGARPGCRAVLRFPRVPCESRGGK